MATERSRYQVATAGQTVADIDAGLRAYMQTVYNYMTGGLVVSGLLAFLVSRSPALLEMIYGTPLSFVVMFAPLGILLYVSFRLQNMSVTGMQIAFWLLSAAFGISLASIFLIYSMPSIVKVFFITAAMFGGMSLYGYTTGKSLASWGSFLFMGLLGIIIASIVNLFMGSDALSFVISLAAVLVFTGLTAYDTQMIKNSYYEGDGAAVMTKKAIYGALHLYLDFLNLFLALLRLFGNRQ